MKRGNYVSVLQGAICFLLFIEKHQKNVMMPHRPHFHPN